MHINKKIFYIPFFAIIITTLILLLTGAASSDLPEGVTPTKVTAHANYWGRDWYFEFWNVGKLGGEQYSKATLNMVFPAPEGVEQIKPIILTGYFTGGPNGDLYLTGELTPGVNAQQYHFKLDDGNLIMGDDGSIANIDNPEAFDAWYQTTTTSTESTSTSTETTSEETTAEPAPTIKLVISEGPVYTSDLDCYYIVKAEVTGDPEPTVKFSADESGGSFGALKAMITLNKDTDPEYTLSATATNSEGKDSAEITLKFIEQNEAPTINLRITGGPVWTTIKELYYIVEAKTTGYPIPEVTFAPPKERIFETIGGNKARVYLNKSETATVQAYAKNSVGKSEIKVITLKWVKPPKDWIPPEAGDNEDLKTFKIESSSGDIYILPPMADRKVNELWQGIKYILQYVPGISILSPPPLIHPDLYEDDRWWTYPKAGMSLKEGYTIKTKDSKGTILLDDGTKILLIEDSLIYISGAGIYVDEGVALIKIPKQQSTSTLINTNQAICNIKGTLFTLSVSQSETVLNVIEGNIDYISKVTGDVIEVNAAESMKATENGFEEKTKFDVAVENNYWNGVEEGLDKEISNQNKVSEFPTALFAAILIFTISLVFLLLVFIIVPLAMYKKLKSR